LQSQEADSLSAKLRQQPTLIFVTAPFSASRSVTLLGQSAIVAIVSAINTFM
jgi:hypothetical protein